MSKTVVWEVHIYEHPEFGQCAVITCPDCKQEVHFHEAIRFDSDRKCNCKTWEVIIKAEGTPKSE